MTTLDINSFLSNKISAADLRLIIDTDVDNYATVMKTKGSSINLNILDNEVINLDLTKTRRLLNETLSGNLTSIHLAFICDCLTLLENITFENDQIQDIIFSIADPEINGGFRIDKDLEEIINGLN
jgi:stress-induced morphogen